MSKRKKWTLVAFRHPNKEKSVYYRQGIVDIPRAVAKAVALGANLMSIRGFDEDEQKGRT